MSSNKIYFADEYSMLVADQNAKDRVRHALRGIQGIPNAAYLVSETRVFVFEKLVKLVVDARLDTQRDVIAILDLSPLAWVCPDEAVRQWAVQPVGYRLDVIGMDKGWQIRHEAFGAIIPCSFLTKDAALTALSKILMGQVVGEGGNLDYFGQALLVHQDVMPLMGQMPQLPLPGVTASHRSQSLRKDSWLPGHSLIDQATFDEACCLETEWREQIGQFEAYVQANFVQLQAVVASLSLAVAHDMPYPLDSDELVQATALEGLYPELQSLSPAWIWHMFGDFCMINGYRNIVVMRDDEFISFMLGKLGVKDCGQYAASEIGLSIAYFLLLGIDFESACIQAQAIHAFSVTLSTRTMYIQRVMQHLAKEEDRELRRRAMQAGRPIHEIGKEIRTFHDFLSFGRKYNARTVVGQDSYKVAN